MKHNMRRSSQEIKDPEKLGKLLDEAVSCRIGFRDDEEPYIVPLNFGWEGTGDAPVILIHCAGKGRKKNLFSRGDTVCFQTDISNEIITKDSPCSWGMKYRSLMGWGVPEEITDKIEKSKILNIITAKYGAGKENVFSEEKIAATSVFSIRLTRLTGKKND